MNYAWDGLWKQTFADDQRGPSVTMAVDFDAYVDADHDCTGHDCNRNMNKNPTPDLTSVRGLLIIVLPELIRFAYKP